MRFPIRWLTISLMLVSTLSFGQVSTGTPPLGSFSSGPDIINLGNLNANLRFPVIHKPGRGLPFDFILSYDSSVWTKVTANGVTSWQPVANFGWRTLTEANVGYISFRSTQITCQVEIDTVPPRFITLHEIVRDQYQYHDMFGTIHNFTNVTGGCPDDIQTNDTVSTDSSGYTLHTGGTLGGSITAPDGTTINPPVGSQTGGGNRIDRNGNEITTNGSSFTDTLGATVLTTSGGVPNPLVLTYTTSTGTQASVTVTYASYTVQTSFGCAGVAEYAATPTSLVSSISYPDGSSYSFNYEPTPGNPLNVTGRLNSITLRTGGKINYAYTGGSHGIICADGSTAGLTRTLTHGSTTDSTTTYARSNPSGSAWTTTVTDGAQNQQVINFEASGTPLANFYETRRSIYQGSATGTPLLQIDTCYNSGTPDCTSTAVALPITEIKRYVTANGIKDSYNDTLLGAFGLTTRVDQYDYRPSPAVLKRRTLISYAPLGNGIVGMPSSITVQDGSSHQVAQTTFNYDESAATPTSGVPQHVAVSGSRGNLTSISRWLNTTSTNLVTVMTYDDTGNMLSSTDPKGHKTQFSYADNFIDGINRTSLAYLSQVTMPDTNSPNLAHHVTFTEYDYNTGLVVATTDQNLKTTLYTYDSLLRPVNTNFPDVGQTTVSYPSATQTAVFRKIDFSDSATEARTLLDGFGRVTRAAVLNGETTLPYDLQDFCYDANGLLRYRSYPYQATAYTGGNDCSNPTLPGDTFAYDGAGRPTQLTHSDGSSVITSYTGRAVQTTDEGFGDTNNTHVKSIQQSDALGNLGTVCELYSGAALLGSGGTPGGCGLDIAGTGFVTSYSYDLLGNLTQIAQGSLPARSFAYDSLSRLTSEMHPEWIANGGTQLATTTYGYDSDSLLISRVRPAPNQSNPAATVTTNYAYDPLHRMLTRTYANDPTGTMPARFAYDLSTSGGVTLQNTIGRLAVSSVDNTAGNLFSYDEMGRVVKNWQCMVQLCATGSYLLQYSYDLVGNMLTANNGVGVMFSYSYNAGGRLAGMTSSLVDSTHPGTLLSNVHYGPYGPSSDTVGNPANSLTESMQYNLYGRTKSYAVAKNGAAVYSFSIPDAGGFAPNWSVKSATDSVNGTWNYSYDQLDRLLSASRTSSPALTLNYAYDRYGNRWQQNSSPEYLFDNNNHIVGSGVVYDALGNVTNDGIHSYAYDAENRVKSVDGGTAYGYDDAGRQLHTPNGEVLFNLDGRPWVVLSPYPQLIPSFEEIYGGGRHLGTYSGNTTNFIHSDWLGTKRLMTDINGNSSETAISQPFGDAFSFTQTEWNSMHFTDDTHDWISGLEHTWFRDYSTIQGRFTTTDPDPGSMELGNPQSLNRYAYVGNDPINYLDPTGLDGLGPGSGGAGGLYPANCTLFDGTPGEVFSCVGSLFGQNQFGAGGGFSFGILGPGFGGCCGGFGGLPLPGCFLPGACNVQLPSLTQQINQWLAGPLNNQCAMSPISDLCGFGSNFVQNNLPNPYNTFNCLAPGQAGPPAPGCVGPVLEELRACDQARIGDKYCGYRLAACVVVHTFGDSSKCGHDYFTCRQAVRDVTPACKLPH